MAQVVTSLLAGFLLSHAIQANPLTSALTHRRCELQGYKINVKLQNCIPRKVEINTCLGSCVSTATPQGTDNSLAPRCDCCKVGQQRKLEVEMKCMGPKGEYSHYHPMYTATSCHCGFCY
uniref:Glycoprotein hormone-like secreted protein n=1 Tax=Tripedalia cystophora TaxID=6141 RepID=A0A481ZNC9_TRICY|nr:glycoprotein hormone-like secreted protein [Tripedalia cystophora]